MVMCCFFGNWIDNKDAVELRLSVPGSDETQVLFASANALTRVVRPEVPLLLGILDLLRD